ncbi:MAG TPA: OmpH family outer membrane protein [Rudaea sp.]|nr:OmpH family outer membrane protein [Rudaea sp.]
MRARAGGRIGIGALLLMLALIPAPAMGQATQPAAEKIGYVDFKRLIDNAPQMIESQTKLQKEFAARDSALTADEKRLVGMRQRYERDGAIMSKTDADALKRDIDTLERAVKRGRDDLHNDFNTRAVAERDRIWQDIDNAVIEYAHANNYDLIVTSPVIYASPRIDITEPVLERLRRAKNPAGAKP